MNNVKKIALAGILSALCFIFLFVGSIFQTLDLTSAALASIIVLIAYIEIGSGNAWFVYAVSSVLSILLLPYKTSAAVFALFAGYYPIIKVCLNKIKPLWLSFVIRILCFNLVLTAMIFIMNRLLSIEDEFFTFGALIYAMANITFVFYDMALERISVYYLHRIKPKLFGRKH